MMKRALLSVVCIAALTPLPALAAPDYAAIVKHIVDDQAVPGYRHLAAATARLADTLAGNCGKADGAAADKQAWHDAADAWQSVQHFRSGPIAKDDRHARLEFWPDDRGIGGRHLAKLIATGTEKDLTGIAGASVAVQGFPALERLLFADTPPALAPASGEKLGTCAVAIAIAGNMAAIAKDLAAEIVLPDPFGADPKEAVRTLFGDLVTSLQVGYQLKLRAPAGDEGKPKTRLAENWRSERSLKNVQLNTIAMKTFYAGIYGPGGTGDQEHEFILDQYDVALKTAQGLGDSVVKVMQRDDGRIQLRALAATLDELKVLGAIKLTEHLDVNLGFNSLDGD